MMIDTRFWQSLDQLVSECRLVIDRPAGTAHPRYPDFIYPFDYGYLEGTQAMDQGGIDIWRGSLSGLKVTGIICTVDLHKKDSEIKILIGCTGAEAQEILTTHNSGSQAGILVLRETKPEEEQYHDRM
jgi:inorganic pyrophosphatase